MENLLNSGIGLILAFQNMGEWLLAPMKFFSFLGTEDFYLIALPIIYWGVDSALGLRLGVMLALTSGFNTIFKFAFHAPRPYWVNTDVQALSAETSFGVPSGHAQNALALWGVVGSYLRKGWVWVLMVFVILGISLSRLYLAVHFPLDTLVGWLIGIALLLSFNIAWEPVSAWAKKQSFAKQILMAFLASMAMLFVGIGVKSIFNDWTMPTAWLQNAARAGGHAPDPFSLSGLIVSSATLFGLFSGVAWIETKGGYRVASDLKKRILQYIVGIIGVVFLYIGLKFIFPSGDDLLASAFRYLRYSLVSFWVSGGAPFVFQKMKLKD
ncbi:MAG: phosphatase PAP2 family protein [Anaerolineae bacterium]|jgi:membrane-associated phospholipid phosphatase|nr:phosphatase PAP2 family protein [Anaerolineae bacterium]MBT7070981.1 phosphatase PAP2 family protein [Anaerolineae bacterium]MBT7325887.1 phosphatase PAP2 family protein [Anaerolineae bacterium]